MSDLVYNLNARDEICLVNEEWRSFAAANEGEPLLSSQILGRVLWGYIGDVATELVYRDLHRRVRTDGVAVRLSFRCDAPARRRLLELDILMGVEGGLIYRVRTLREQERDSVPLLEPHRPRSETLVRVCSWCNRVAAPPHGWLPVEEAITVLSLFAEPRPPQLTHGICEDCIRILDDTPSGEPVNAVLARL